VLGCACNCAAVRRYTIAWREKRVADVYVLLSFAAGDR
jgi:hypothetical protein